MHKYEELDVWQLAYELTKAIYIDTRTFPRDERFGLTSQIRRSAVSIMSSIAEGAGRFTPGEFRNLVSVAAGPASSSSASCESPAISATCRFETQRERRLVCDRIGKMLYRLHNSLQA